MSRSAILRFLPVIGVLGLLCACQRQPNSGLQESQLQIAGKQFTVELALTPAQQEVGLMHRATLDPDHGMLFIFPDEKERTFWNHDVSFPLDLVFLDAQQRIASIKRLETYSEHDVSSDVPAEFAIELRAGTADQLHLQIGAKLPIPNDALKASAR